MPRRNEALRYGSESAGKRNMAEKSKKKQG